MWRRISGRLTIVLFGDVLRIDGLPACPHLLPSLRLLTAERPPCRRPTPPPERLTGAKIVGPATPWRPFRLVPCRFVPSCSVACYSEYSRPVHTQHPVSSRPVLSPVPSDVSCRPVSRPEYRASHRIPPTRPQHPVMSHGPVSVSDGSSDMPALAVVTAPRL